MYFILFLLLLWVSYHHSHNHLDGQIGATKSRRGATRVISNDCLNSGVQSRAEQEKANNHHENVDDGHYRPAHAVEEAALVHLPVGDGEEDEAEEGVEGRTEQGQEVTHAGDDLREDEGDDPDTGHGGNPSSPSEGRVAVSVS